MRRTFVALTLSIAAVLGSTLTTSAAPITLPAQGVMVSCCIG